LTSRSIELQRPPRIVGQAAPVKGAASIDGEAPPTLRAFAAKRDRSERVSQARNIDHIRISDQRSAEENTVTKNPAHSFAAHLFIFVFASRVAAPGVRDNKVGTDN
jgi:hypothetical protein